MKQIVLRAVLCAKSAPGLPETSSIALAMLEVWARGGEDRRAEARAAAVAALRARAGEGDVVKGMGGVASGERRMANGEWRMANGEWRMGQVTWSRRRVGWRGSERPGEDSCCRARVPG